MTHLIKNSEQHFDDIADDYDYWKNHNRYYYQNLFKLYSSFIPPESSVIEIGCGTGDILAHLNPRQGKGIDVSDQMIRIARKKHAGLNNISFERQNIFDSTAPFAAEFVYLADVLEHVDRLPDFLKQLSLRIDSRATVIISVANPRWEWLLMLAERLHMKMPEGPHERISIEETERLYELSGFKIVEKGYRLLVPKRLPGADWVNDRFYKKATFRKFGFVVYWVLKKNT